MKRKNEGKRKQTNEHKITNTIKNGRNKSKEKEQNNQTYKQPKKEMQKKRQT